MSWFNNWIDKHFEKQGYKLVRCDKYGARYIKYVKEYNYNSVIHILQKNSGNHIVQCYDENVITASVDNKTVFVNSVDGIDASLSFWIWLKFHQLKHKYKWDKVKKHD